MRIRSFISAFFVQLVSMAASHAQTQLDALKNPLVDYGSAHLQEKIFVHTDKSFYTTGEIIWFKLYVTDAQYHLPLDLSKVAYVEVLNKDHRPVLQGKVALDSGSGAGSFQLPYSINSGNFILRAYTNWMKNESADFFFEKTITIVNTLKNPDWPAAAKPAYDVQFFPEGGNLLHGVETVIGFKGTGEAGVAIPVRGALLNERNDTVAHFTSLHAGMGRFTFTPDAGSVYHAVIILPDGTSFNKPFPAIETAGMAMHLREIDKDRIAVGIQSKQAGSVVSLIVHTRGAVKLAATRELFGGRTEIEIDKKDLGDGISHFTVFTQDNKPACERLYFKPPVSLDLSAVTDAAEYGRRKRVSVDIAAVNSVRADLSMSVYRLDSLQEPDNENILSYLWLQSDLRGRIESPAYYFSSGPEVQQAADNLMLTQGWRRFRWENVLGKSNPSPEFLPETEGHLVTGKLVNKASGASAANIVSYLSVPAEKPLFVPALSAADGNIRFNVKDFYGGNEVILQTNPQTADSIYRVDLANPFSEKYSSTTPPALTLSESAGADLLNRSIAAQSANVFYPERRQRFLYPQAMDSTPFYGRPDKKYYLDDYTRFQTMEEVMREYVQDVHVHKNNGHFTYTVRNRSFDAFFETHPLVLIDGVPVFDVDTIISFDPLKVKRVDVVSQKFYQNSFSHDGIISYHTYQADLAGFPLDGNALVVEYEGMQLRREFYSPDYAADAAPHTPDFRNVLYWDPSVRTSGDGKARVNFYTGDLPGRYAVMLQGIGGGQAGAKWFTFTVR